MLTLLPLAGLTLLMRFPEAGQAGIAYALVTATLGLLGVLVGLRHAWSNLSQPVQAMTGLAQVQVNLAFLAAVWGGGEAALAETRLLLAVAVLYLAVNRLWTRWQLAGPLLAVAALAGLPLTAGFASRTALYTAWWENGRFLLILVLALMHIPLVTAGLWLMWQPLAGAPGPRTQAGAWLLPLFGLVSLAGIGHRLIPVWLAVLLPFALGLIALRFGPGLNEVRAILQRAFTFSGLHFWPRHLPFLVVTNVGLALREAARILEGERGLLWLLAFIVILLLVRG
jgi:hypothetical protein